MSTEETTTNNIEENICSYLVDNPDFLAKHPEVLAVQKIPHETGGAISLIEHQVKILQNRSETYRQQLQELIEIARENDQLNRQLHRLTLSLIETGTRDEMLGVLQDGIRNDFKADVVELKLFPNDEVEAHATEPGTALFQEFIAADKPSCGTLAEDQLQFLFGPQAEATGSVALVPVKTNALSGILAIGSSDRQRFHHGQGIDFLLRLGEIVSLSLQNASTSGS